MQKPDYSKISPELRAKLEEMNRSRPENKSLEKLEDIASILQELLSDSDDARKSTNKTIEEFGVLLTDARESLQTLASKEDKELPDFAKPITDMLTKVLTAINSKEYSPKIEVKSPNVKVDAPQVNVNAPDVDLKGIEKLLKTEVPKAFEEAISKIPETVIPEYPDRWNEVLEWLEDISNATRKKPIPGSMTINNTGSNPVPITGTITAEASTLAEFQFNDSDDTTTASTEYFGYTKPDGTWLVKKLTDTTLRYATVTNNGAVTTYASAWAAIASLTYGRMDEAF